MPISTNCPHQAYCEMREQSDMRFISHLTRNTFAIILAGGRGTRLKQLTDFRSKPAVPFAGKPVKQLDLDITNPRDQPCFTTGAAQNSGIIGGTPSGNSVCSDSMWNITATAVPSGCYPAR